MDRPCAVVAERYNHKNKVLAVYGCVYFNHRSVKGSTSGETPVSKTDSLLIDCFNLDTLTAGK